MSWYVYIVECSDGTFYTGCTSNIEKRIKSHNAGTGAKYTSGRRPVRVCYQETVADRSSALKREYQLKQLTVEKKRKIISAGY